MSFHGEGLTLIWVGYLGVRFEVGRGVKLPPPCLKLVRIMLETWILVRKYIHVCSFRKYTFQYPDCLNFDDVSIFFPKIGHFLAKIVLLLEEIL